MLPVGHSLDLYNRKTVYIIYMALGKIALTATAASALQSGFIPFNKTCFLCLAHFFLQPLLFGN